MGLYAARVLPYVIHLAMRQEALLPYRRRVISGATGRVLEIGVGSGLNLPLYPPSVTHVVGLDPSAALLRMAERRAAINRATSIALLRGDAQHLPLRDKSVDTVVMTWTLCSVGDASSVLREIRRVLKANGSLLFAEHGQSPDPRERRWQNRLTPLWKRIAGGCHLNRSVARLLDEAGFAVTHLENSYLEGPKFLTYMYEGRASL